MTIENQTPELSDAQVLKNEIEHFKGLIAGKLTEQSIFMRLRNVTDLPTQAILRTEDQLIPEDKPRSLGVSKEGLWTNGNKELENQGIHGALTVYAYLTNPAMSVLYTTHLTLLEELGKDCELGLLSPTQLEEKTLLLEDSFNHQTSYFIGEHEVDLLQSLKGDLAAVYFKK